MSSPTSPVHRYHDGTKHQFNRFARALGYLDWASQPHPFRSYAGARTVPLVPSPDAAGLPAYSIPPADYDDLFADSIPPQSLTAAAIGDVLRHSLGLSAWKQYGRARWSLRVNPSSGNLHPTEAYVVSGPLDGLSPAAAVFHYAAERHALEERCTFDPRAWIDVSEGRDVALVVLTSIHWRESWKYGERAFRYCQHDLGHAIAALALAARMLGWTTTMLPAWSHPHIAALAGLDRDEDFSEAEREEPGCALALTVEPTPPAALAHRPDDLVAAVRSGEWSGHASQLSEDHVQWTFIDEVARETIDSGHPSLLVGDQQFSTGAGAPPPARADDDARPRISSSSGSHGRRRSPNSSGHPALPAHPARDLVIQRRSAVAFDGTSTISSDAFFAMLARVLPSDGAPWHALWWTPRVHLFLFVHRVDGLEPGMYLFGRDSGGFARLQAAIQPHELEAAHPSLPLMRLARGDCRGMARRLSCDQDIASDGFFSFGMIAEFDASLVEHGPSFYRHLFWETGVVGQVMYLEAEAAGVRATGIGCFYDDPVHHALGLQDHAFQSLYHFTVGMPVEDTRLTTEPGYAWG